MPYGSKDSKMMIQMLIAAVLTDPICNAP